MTPTAYTLRRALPGDGPALAALALLLWPEHTEEALREEFKQYVMDDNIACFLAMRGDEPVGFAHCQLRHDYVEGTKSSPVGYLEGIYVAEAHRAHGVAARLVAACETWSRAHGCREFASDCELHNTDSLRFHLAAGFEEAGRIICFKKEL